MIILDTNVLSEAMKGHVADRAVLTWLRSLRTQPVTTIINLAEVRAGIANLPAGRRRDEYQAAAEEFLANVREVLPLTDAATFHFAQVLSERKVMGRETKMMDALIAGIAREVGMPIATRNVRDFDGLGIELVNPWEAPPG